MRSLALTLLWVGCALAHPPADLLLTTDRLAYAPNQEIHARALALSSETRAPVEGLEITLTLRGRVGAARFEVRERARTSALGVAHARFSISEEVEGGLRLTASAPEARQSARRLHVTPPAPRDARARSRGAMEGSPRLTLGWLHPPLLDVDNRLVITAQDPGGRPLDLPVEVRVGSAVRRVETGPDGVALIDAPLRTTDDVVEARAGGVEARLEARHAARGEAVARADS